MKRFDEMNQRELKAARDDLRERLQEHLRATRIQSLTNYGVFIEGGEIPVRYDAMDGEIRVWSKSSRYSGSSFSVSELARIQLIIQQFYTEHGIETEKLNPNTIEITKREYDSLASESAHLSALEQLGVDNWSGYIGANPDCEDCGYVGDWSLSKCPECSAEWASPFDYL